jgi:uncharacterized protein YigE (DUF2233 family)
MQGSSLRRLRDITRYAQILTHICLVGLPMAAFAADVTELNVGGVSLTACTMDLRKDRLAMHWKSDAGQVYGSLRALDVALHKQGKKIVCGTNGGIFDQSQRPLGLYIENGTLLRRLNLRRNAYGNFYLQPNGVFLLYPERAEIVTTEEYQAKPDEEKRLIAFANQSGPLLVRNGEPNPLFPADSANITTRNAVCVRSPTSVALVVTADPVTFYDFARVLAERFACQAALYLDGTLSTFYPARRAGLERALGVLFAVTAP